MTDDPEERIFYRIARHLGKFVGEVKDGIPTSELIGWVAELNKVWTEPDLYCHYLAQIAHQVYLLRCSLPFTGMKPKVGFDAFLHIFKEKAKKGDKPETLGKPLQRTARGKLIDPEWQARIDATEAAVMAMIGQTGQKVKVEEPKADPKEKKSPGRTHRSK